MEAASQKPRVVARSAGDMDKAMAGAKTKLDAIYQLPFLAHTTMEPINCTAHVRKDGCEIWVGTQVLARAQSVAASITGLPPERVIVHNHLLGGGFDRRLDVDFIAQAVKIAMHVDGPVKVMWTREEDIQHDVYRPYFFDRITAGLDADGMPVALATSSWWKALSTNSRRPPKQTPWRIASACSRASPRARAVLQLAAERSGWGQPMPDRTGRGIANCVRDFHGPGRAGQCL